MICIHTLIQQALLILGYQTRCSTVITMQLTPLVSTRCRGEESCCAVWEGAISSAVEKVGGPETGEDEDKSLLHSETHIVPLHKDGLELAQPSQTCLDGHLHSAWTARGSDSLSHLQEKSSGPCVVWQQRQLESGY